MRRWFPWIALLVVFGGVALFFRFKIANPVEQSSRKLPMAPISGGLDKTNTTAIKKSELNRVRQEWVEALASNSANIQLVEEEILENPTSHIEWLKELLQKEIIQNVQHAEFTAIILGKIGTPEAVHGIVEAYGQAYGYQRQDAVSNETVAERENFLHVFEVIQNPAAAAALIDEAATKKTPPELYLVLIKTVARLADETLLRTLLSDLSAPTTKQIQRVADDILSRVPANILAPMAAEQFLLPDLPPNVLNLLSNTLGEDGSETSIKALRSRLDTVSGRERQTVLDGLFHVHNKEAIPLLQKLAVEDPDRDVRKFAVYAFSNFPPKLAIPILNRLMIDPRIGETKSQVEFVIKLLNKQGDSQ